MRIFKWIDSILHPYVINETNISNSDIYTQLIARIEKLENENVALTNCLYEVENRLQAKIDNIHPVTYTLHNYGLDK
jgi:hypothetical protein